jgi:hypothetical protein
MVLDLHPSFVGVLRVTGLAPTFPAVQLYQSLMVRKVARGARYGDSVLLQNTAVDHPPQSRTLPSEWIIGPLSLRPPLTNYLPQGDSKKDQMMLALACQIERSGPAWLGVGRPEDCNINFDPNLISDTWLPV